mmetsp:Transcript_73365/g.174786  ORF Transcript_73365/g.174786 Transcript_73365/m.174786 type:complete len:339 (+) Transcript_73365:289-1305(+)
MPLAATCACRICTLSSWPFTNKKLSCKSCLSLSASCSCRRSTSFLSCSSSTSCRRRFSSNAWLCSTWSCRFTEAEEEELTSRWCACRSFRSSRRRSTSCCVAAPPPLPAPAPCCSASFLEARSSPTCFFKSATSELAVWFWAWISCSCACNRSTVTEGQDALAPSEHCTWRPSTTSVKPLMVSVSCSCSCCFSWFVFRSTFSQTSFWTMARFSSLISLSSTMQVLSRLSLLAAPPRDALPRPVEAPPAAPAPVGPPAAAPPPPPAPKLMLAVPATGVSAAIGWMGRISFTTSAGCRNFRRWKQRIVKAIKSLTVLDGAWKLKVRPSPRTSWNLLVSSV